MPRRLSNAQANKRKIPASLMAHVEWNECVIIGDAYILRDEDEFFDKIYGCRLRSTLMNGSRRTVQALQDRGLSVTDSNIFQHLMSPVMELLTDCMQQSLVRHDCLITTKLELFTFIAMMFLRSMYNTSLDLAWKWLE